MQRCSRRRCQDPCESVYQPVYVMQNHVLSTILSELPKDSKVLLVLLRCALAIDPWLEDASKRRFEQ